jgi:hypothetical protein
MRGAFLVRDTGGVKRIAGSLGVAAGVLVATLAILAAGGFGTPDPAARRLDLLGVILATASSAPLALRWRRPFPVYLVSAAGSVALLGLGYPPSSNTSVGRRRPTRRRRASCSS